MNLKIVNAIETLRPNAQWVLRGDALDGLDWLDAVQSRPTDDEINAAILAYVQPTTVQGQLDELRSQFKALVMSLGK